MSVEGRPVPVGSEAHDLMELLRHADEQTLRFILDHDPRVVEWEYRSPVPGRALGWFVDGGGVAVKMRGRQGRIDMTVRVG